MYNKIFICLISVFLFFSCGNDSLLEPPAITTFDVNESFDDLFGTWTVVAGSSYEIDATTLKTAGVEFAILEVDEGNKSFLVEVTDHGLNMSWTNGQFTKVFWKNFGQANGKNELEFSISFPALLSETDAKALSVSASPFDSLRELNVLAWVGAGSACSSSNKSISVCNSIVSPA